MNSTAAISLAAAFGLGAVVSALSARIRVPAVLPLLIVGVAVGPSGLGLVNGATLGGRDDMLGALIVLSIGLLVFEGGLHLDRRELARAPRAVLGLLSAGMLVTWAGAATLAVFVLDFEWPIAIVLGSMLIVTGPTVVQPILRRVRMTPRLHSVLSAEAILIDPIGVVLAILTLELVVAFYAGGFEGALPGILEHTAIPIVGGLVVGVAIGVAGVLLVRLFAVGKLRSGSADPLNVAVTGVCMLAIAAGELVVAEGGLVAATIAAVILSNSHAIARSEVRQFKEQVATLLVGMLFILLASKIDVTRISSLGVPHLIFIGVLLFVIRPISAGLATIGSRMKPGERLFAGLFAPRGIVAASIATLVAVQLVGALGTFPEGEREAERSQIADLDLIVWAVICASVLWATIAAWPLGRVLGVLAGPPRGVLVVGAHLLGRATAKALRAAEVPVVVIDSNVHNCELARREGVMVICADATEAERLTEISREHDVGWVLAWTGNEDVDRIVGRWAERVLGQGRAVIGVPAIPGQSESARPSLGQIDHLLHQHELLVETGPPSPGVTYLLTVREGRPSREVTPETSNGKDTIWLHLRSSRPQPTAAPVDA